MHKPFLRNAETPMGPKDIAEVTDISHDVVRQLCPKMVMQDQIEKIGRGRYVAI